VTVWLHGLGHFHPENEITNRFLEELDIGTSDEWILERVGIRSRRTVLDLDYIRATRNRDVRAAAEASGYTTAELARRAAELALARAGVAKSDVGMVISGSCAPDFTSPADACRLARLLELDVPALDVSSACTSFLAQLHLLSLIQPEKLPAYVLVAASDALTRTVDYGDRASAVLWGDGAAAAVVSTRVPGRALVLGTELASRPAGAETVVVPRTGHFAQEGRAVQTFAIRKSAESFERLRAAFSEEDRELHFVGHQANLRVLEAVCRRCEIAPRHHHANVTWYGNTAGASSASVVSMGWEKWTGADDVAVVGVGAGLTWSSYLLRFGEAA
jgi:3-oxoacyl-[acyl-carrier-protein] synthase-3